MVEIKRLDVFSNYLQEDSNGLSISFLFYCVGIHVLNTKAANLLPALKTWFLAYFHGKITIYIVYVNQNIVVAANLSDASWKILRKVVKKEGCNIFILYHISDFDIVGYLHDFHLTLLSYGT